MKKNKKKWTGTRAYSPKAEIKYTGLRSGFSNSIFMDETLDKMLKMALDEEYRNNPETMSLLKITGIIKGVDKRVKWMATKEDMRRFFQLAEQLRYDKKYPLTKAEASARFLTGKQPRKIADKRPTYFNAKPSTPYIPRKGSSKGKLKVVQKGAVKTEQALRKFFQSIFMMGDKVNKQQAKMKSVGLTRSITKEI